MTHDAPLRALVVMPLAEQRGGSELALLHLIEHGRDVDWMIAFLCDGPMLDAVRRLGARAIALDTGRLRQPRRFARAVLHLRRLIRDREIDVVLSWLGKGQIYGGIAAALARVPAVWFQHGLPRSPHLQDRLATTLPARRILACSAAAAEAQSRIWPRRPTHVIHPGVDLARFDPAALPSPADCRGALGLPPSCPLIGIVARLQRWKGVHHAIDAMPRVLAVHRDARLVIVGGDHAFEPDYPRQLRERIDRLALRDRVIFAGLQSDVPRWMNAMDVVVHASDAEPFGLVVIEAMALGKPTLATATAGPTEIIRDGIDGLLWRPGDVQALANAILRVLSDDPFAAGLGRAARERAAAFTAQRYAAAVVRSIREAAAPAPCFHPLAEAPCTPARPD